MKRKIIFIVFALIINGIFSSNVFSHIGKRFPSERKVVIDPVTGVKLIFLTSLQSGDSKIYPTHNQWTSDGNWIIFRSRRVRGEAMAVNEKSGDIVQVTEGGYRGTLIVARKSMKLYYMKRFYDDSNPREIIEVNLDKLFEDSEKGALKDASFYQKVCGVIPADYGANGELAFDADEEWLWFRVGKEKAMKYLPEDATIEGNFGPRNMGAGPGGIAGINVKTGEIKYVVSVPFQVGHIQSNPWAPGQIVFCWETGGKSPQRTWIVNSDGTGLRPLYPEAPYEWVTHEVVITPDEVAFAILGHRKIPGINKSDETDNESPGQEAEWGNCGTREKPTGLAIVNIKTREMMIAGQIPYGSGFWHVVGSHDGRFAAGDNFAREIYLIDRQSHEMKLLSAGHKTTAADHPHPSFSPDGSKILIQSAMLSEDGRSMNLCIIPIPEDWLGKHN
ncbi:WD40 domain-containing protein [Melioribacter roseus P3M-2]|uniref:WD40 domain-containing protein n=1 Tax=Melioribacter roseus (strain DSM 23840 / JCM 17771 / VKM B-2668 / P3M-2) TaxID=1191523 RepID=I6YRZ2_MELRP|nr:PD40 domain-containing protein [Melioribacter roseus]AFN73322.1 WD40 domain-containing protein [Melioribacter roseus P3M-2]